MKIKIYELGPGVWSTHDWSLAVTLDFDQNKKFFKYIEPEEDPIDEDYSPYGFIEDSTGTTTIVIYNDDNKINEIKLPVTWRMISKNIKNLPDFNIWQNIKTETPIELITRLAQEENISYKEMKNRLEDYEPTAYLWTDGLFHLNPED